MSEAPTRIGYNAFACYEGDNLAIEAPRDQSVECRHLGSVRIVVQRGDIPDLGRDHHRKGGPMTPAAEAFLAKHPTFTRDPIYGCWTWTGRLDKRDGYGVIWSHNKATAAYVAFYTALVGPPPKGLVLDHLCRNRECVRPAHLEPVTGAENDRRRSWRYRSRMAKCPRGHSLATCIVTPEGGRICRTCAGPEAAS